MKKDFVFEIGTEELPVAASKIVIEELPTIINEILDKNRIVFEDINVLTTPCRISIYLTKVDDKQRQIKKEVMGPPIKVSFKEDGSPAAALLGFAKKMNVAIKDLKRQVTPKGEYFSVVINPNTVSTIKVLPDICKDIISRIPFPKTMIFNDSRVRFSRPIRWFFLIFGNDKVKFDFAGVKSSRHSYGLGGFRGKKLEINDVKKYITTLKNNFVLLDNIERKKMITKQIEVVAKKKGRPFLDEDLLNEVTGLNEYPTAIIGSFSEEFLKIPQEIVTTVLKHHQKFFALKDDKDKLLPFFIGIKNGISEYINIVKSGFEKVLAARLKDAQFFYEQDLKLTLRDRVQGLKKIVYQEKLGSLYDKLERIKRISGTILKHISHDNKQEITKTVNDIILLSKVDLTTDVVYEFPELQGIMGSIYAKKNGEDKIVAKGIESHYLPKFIGDRLPKGIEASIVSIADKLDNIISLFLLGERPKGSKDPFGFRRQSVGIIDIILSNKINISLELLIRVEIVLLKEHFEEAYVNEVKDLIIEFFKKRFENWLIDKGFKFDEVRAIIYNDKFCDFNDLLLKAKAIKDFRKSKDFDDIITLYKRAYNIIRQARDKGLLQTNVVVKENLFSFKEEKKLWNKLKEDIEKTGNDYKATMNQLKDLKPELDNFFDKVMVMDEQVKLRDNRLAMLEKLVNSFGHIADFSKIQN